MSSPIMLPLALTEHMARRKQARPRGLPQSDQEEPETAATATEEIHLFKCQPCNIDFVSLIEFMSHKNSVCEHEKSDVPEDGVADAASVDSQDPNYQDSDSDSSGSMQAAWKPLPFYMPGPMDGLQSGSNDVQSNPYPCQFCDKRFSRLSYLKRHEQVHSDKMPFKCDFCQRLFKHKRSRDRHVRLHTGDKKYHCPVSSSKIPDHSCSVLYISNGGVAKVCTASFSRSDHLKIHLKTHNSSKPYQCLICNRGYTTTAALTAHTQTHHRATPGRDKEFRCLQCTHTFTTALDLQTHILTHSSSGAVNHTVKCNSCGGGFLTTEELHTHTESCQLIEKFHCNACSDGFTNRESLSLHVAAVHSTSMLQLCPFCGKGDFASPAVLRYHVETIHGNVLTTLRTTCHLCRVEFPNMQSLSEHMQVTHKHLLPPMSQAPLAAYFNRYPCRYCTKSFDDVSLLDLHVTNSHSYSELLLESGFYFCRHCTLSFSSELSFLDHARRVHGYSGDTILCSLCPERFSNYSQLIQHFQLSHKEWAEKLQFACIYGCGMFDNMDSLKMHLENNHQLHTSIPNSIASSSNGDSMPNTSVPRDSPTTPNKKTEPSPDTPSSVDNPNHDFSKFVDKLQRTTDFSAQDSKKPLKNHVCLECGLDCSTGDQLHSHYIGHFHNLKVEYGCTKCSKVYVNVDDLQRHLFEIHSQNLFKCVLCNEVFDNKVSIQVHFAIKHSNESRSYRCSKCPFVANTELLFKQHMLAKHLDCGLNNPDTPVNGLCPKPGGAKCAICGESFSTITNLDHHVHSAHSVTPMKRECTTPNDVTQPAADKKPNMFANKKGFYPCLLCSEAFVTEIDLCKHRAGHMLKQTGPKCTLCNAAFASSSNLSAHMFEHKSNNVGNTCSFCKESLETERDYLIHCDKHVLSNSPLTATHVECIVCKQPLTSMVELTTHAKYHTQVKPDSQHLYRCSVCYRGYESKLYLSCKMDGNGCPCYVCKECVSGFANNGQLNAPATISKHACPRCNAQFESLRELEQHTAKHVQEALLPHYQCIICKMAFKSELEIETHVRSVHLAEERRRREWATSDAAMSECRLCKRFFATAHALKTHLIEHSFFGRELACPACQDIFGSVVDLEVHCGEKHPDSTAHACHLCSNSYRYEAELQNHLLGHTSGYMDRHQCPECHRIFGNVVNLTNHMKIHDSKDKGLKCSLCNSSFSQVGDLQQHYFTQHGGDTANLAGGKKETFTCPQCQETFPCLSNLQGHLRIHTQDKTFDCTQCGKVFALSRNLTIHMRSHSGERPYACPIAGCGKRFARKENRKVHLKSHDGIKPFMCPHCGKLFSRKCHVKDHMRTHSLSDAEPLLKCQTCNFTTKLQTELRDHVQTAHSQSSCGSPGSSSASSYGKLSLEGDVLMSEDDEELDMNEFSSPVDYTSKREIPTSGGLH